MKFSTAYSRYFPKFTILFLGILLITFSGKVSAASFSDIPSDHPQYAAVESLKNLGIVSGYSDGKFHAERTVSRVEALKMILQSAKTAVPETTENSGFSDVSTGDWFFKYVVAAKKATIVSGNSNGTFAPARTVTTVEFLKMLLQSFHTDLSHRQDLSQAISADTKAGQWYLPYLSYAAAVGIIAPTLDDKLFPEKALTRGECAMIIYKMLILERGGEPQKMLNLTEAELVTLLVDLNNNNIAAALEHAKSAVFYSEQALKASPQEGIVKAANKIARGFQQLCFAYASGLQKKYDALEKYVTAAKDLAGQAYADDSSTRPLGQKIKEQGDILLKQVPKSL